MARRLRRFALLLLVPFALSASCKKSASKKDDSPEAAKADTEAKIKDDKPDDDKPKDDKPEPPAKLVDPGTVSLEQAIATVGKRAAHRMIIRAPALVQAGFIDQLMKLMPADDRAKYDKFVNATGFNPAKRVTGAVFYANGKLDDLKSGELMMVFGISGDITAQFVDELEKLDDDDDDDDDDDERIGMAVLVNMTADARAKLVEAFKKRDPGKPAVESEMVGDAHVFASREGRSIQVGYLWSGGLVFLQRPDPKGDLLAAAKVALAPALAELAEAGKATPKPGPETIKGRGFGGGVTANFSIEVGSDIVVAAKVTPRKDDLGKVEKTLQAIPQMKARPELLLANVPPEAHEIMKLCLAGFDAQIENGVVDAKLKVNTEAAKTAIEPLIKAAK